MSETTRSVELNVVDSNGDVTILHPATNPSCISTDSSAYKGLPSGSNTLDKVLQNMTSTAFVDKNKLAFINTSEEVGDCTVPESEINDEVTSLSSTWSSTKLSKSFPVYKADLDSFSSSYDSSIVNKIYDYPTTFVIRDKSLSVDLADACHVSNTNTYILVEYFPYYCYTNSQDKSVTDYNNIRQAFQRWTSPVMGITACREYKDGSWGELIQIK